MLQARVRNPNGVGQVWASPERDIVYAMQGYIDRTVSAIKSDIDARLSEPERSEALKTYTDVANSVAALVSDLSTGKDIQESFRSSGVLDFSPEQADAYNRMCWWFMRVVLGAYHRGVLDTRRTADRD